jgi:hypothetical protein
MLFRGVDRLGFLVLVLAVQCQRYKLLLRPAHIQNRQALKELKLLLLVAGVLVGAWLPLQQITQEAGPVVVVVVQLLSTFQHHLSPALFRLRLAPALIHLAVFVRLLLALLERVHQLVLKMCLAVAVLAGVVLAEM